MRERKAQMEARADALLALPGGLGQVRGALRDLDRGYLRLHTEPVVLLDPDGHWAACSTWVRDIAGQGCVDPEALRRLVVTTDVDAALDACVGPVPADGSRRGG